MTTTKKVVVLGPNGINDATFHVHAAACRDLNTRKYHGMERDWTTEISNIRELTEELWGDFIGTEETEYTDADGNEVRTTWLDYVGETRVFDCVGLPQE